jgi:hypothetical protein
VRQRRSRSPDHVRGSVHSPREGSTRVQNRFPVDRGYAARDRDPYGDRYRPRSPSPRGTFRGRDSAYRGGRARSRSFDRYDGRRRSRSRSRSPVGYPSRYRSRSRSPRGPKTEEIDDLPLPRRAARDVPDVQIILTEELDRYVRDALLQISTIA